MDTAKPSSDEFALSLRQLVSDRRIRLLLIDLDGTLISESDFLFHSYKAIATFGLGMDTESADREACRLLKDLHVHGRQGLLDRLAERHGRSPNVVPDWLQLMRRTQVPGGLAVAPWALSILSDDSIPAWVITNGNPTQQRTKFSQVQPNWMRSRLGFIAADELSPKPSPVSLKLALRRGRKDAREALFVGDSDIDAEAAQNAGVHFLRAPSSNVFRCRCRHH